MKDIVESWEVILLMKLLHNEGIVESWKVIKLLQAETMKDLVESWNVILLMKLLQALIIWNPGRSFR